MSRASLPEDKYSTSGGLEDGNVPPTVYEDVDVFGHEDGHDIKYKTLSWQLVALLMIAEIVTNGMLSLPSSLAVVGIVPGLILIVFLGIFATYTAWILVQFKLRHPEVHNMGDAGMILFGPIGREVLAGGTVIFAVFAAGSQMLSGEIALAALSDNKLCTLLYTGIFAIPILVCSFPRTLNSLSWLCIPSCISILIAGIVGMVGAGVHPVPDRVISTTESPSFYSAFVSITNPVFAYAGHFMFFVMISEMKHPQDAMKAAYTLQGFATTFYALFAAILYVYVGNDVASPAFSSLSPKWMKAAYGIAIPNFIIAGALCSHTAAKLFFLRMFRHSDHLHSHTKLGWSVWVVLIVLANGAAFVLAVGVPIFNYLVGLVASLFASWYTYGVAGAFWLHDEYHDGEGFRTWRRKWVQCGLAIGTFLAGAFICVAGTYVNVKGIVEAYQSGEVPGAFTC
ncbi:transmembrane amino acid transporter [Saccharata proteae CBS 121410]|uniref:Transmembrane amino acid transporter n=1 Tax=Saccharata proteae CBS 121410 TaxID=1314787 RepID=A0A9P4HWH0_9PEZI|nr:transmembrane amino acid transporter [Saccharata proteae CBS 121410]